MRVVGLHVGRRARRFPSGGAQRRGWAGEVVELALKGLLRSVGLEPPRVHDVSEILLAERARLPASVDREADRLARFSRDLRRDRELAFYGAEDLTPSGFYSRDDAERALAAARETVAVVAPHVPPLVRRKPRARKRPAR